MSYSDLYVWLDHKHDRFHSAIIVKAASLTPGCSVESYRVSAVYSVVVNTHQWRYQKGFVEDVGHTELPLWPAPTSDGNK